MEIEKIERSDELIVRNYNELVDLYKATIQEKTFLNDKIKWYENELEEIRTRNQKLENEFDKEIEKKLTQKNGVLVTQNKQLRIYNDKHIKEKDELKKKNKKLQKEIEKKEKDLNLLLQTIAESANQSLYAKNITPEDSFFNILIELPDELINQHWVLKEICNSSIIKNIKNRYSKVE